MVFWISLAVLLVAVVAGIAYCVVRGLQLYRDAKRASGRITAEMERISDVTLQIERQSAKAAAAVERLQGATGRLAVSRARLDVQLAAVREAQAQLRRTFWFVPGSERRRRLRPARNLHVSPTRSASEAPKLTA